MHFAKLELWASPPFTNCTLHPAQLQQPLFKKSSIFDWVRSDIDDADADADADPDDDDVADADAAPALDDADARANRLRKF